MLCTLHELLTENVHLILSYSALTLENCEPGHIIPILISSKSMERNSLVDHRKLQLFNGMTHIDLFHNFSILKCNLAHLTFITSGFLL
jgi:hypothetical protein